MADYSDEEQGEIRCICNFTQDDGFTIQCERCLVWQHADCVGVDEDDVPDKYHCEQCFPRKLDAERAYQIQRKKIAAASKRLKNQKHKKLLEKAKKSSKIHTRNSSVGGSPNSSIVRTIKKKTRKRSELGSPLEHQSSLSPGHNGTQVKDQFAYDSQAAEDLVNRICQVLHRSKGSMRKRTMSVSSVPPTASLSSGLNYLLASSTPETDTDPKSVALLDNDFLDSVRVDVEVQRVSPKGAGRRIVEGLFVKDKVSPGQFIVEVTGNVILKSEYMHNPSNLYRLLGTVLPEVMFHTSLNLAVDCRDNPCPACILRRHCTPNAELRSFFVSGVDTNVVHLGVFATTEIQRGDEIFIPWTLSEELFPDGLVDVEDEAKFKRFAIQSFSKAVEKVGSSITPNQTKSLMHTLRKDNCPCNQDPACAINSLLRARRQFWSKQRVSAQNEPVIGNESPKSNGRVSSVQPPPVKPKKITEDLFEADNSISKLSGSDTELDTSGQFKAPRMVLEQEEEGSATNSSLDVLDDPPKNKSTSRGPKQISFPKPSEELPTPTKSKRAIEPEVSSPKEGFRIMPGNKSGRIALLRTMSLKKFLIYSWKKEHGIKPKSFKSRTTTPLKKARQNDQSSHKFDRPRQPRKLSDPDKLEELPQPFSDAEEFKSPTSHNKSLNNPFIRDNKKGFIHENVLKDKKPKGLNHVKGSRQTPPRSFDSPNVRHNANSYHPNPSPKIRLNHKHPQKKEEDGPTPSGSGVNTKNGPEFGQSIVKTSQKKRSKMAWQQFVIDRPNGAHPDMATNLRRDDSPHSSDPSSSAELDVGCQEAFSPPIEPSNPLPTTSKPTFKDRLDPSFPPPPKTNGSVSTKIEPEEKELRNPAFASIRRDTDSNGHTQKQTNISLESSRIETTRRPSRSPSPSPAKSRTKNSHYTESFPLTSRSTPGLPHQKSIISPNSEREVTHSENRRTNEPNNSETEEGEVLERNEAEHQAPNFRDRSGPYRASRYNEGKEERMPYQPTTQFRDRYPPTYDSDRHDNRDRPRYHHTFRDDRGYRDLRGRGNGDWNTNSPRDYRSPNTQGPGTPSESSLTHHSYPNPSYRGNHHYYHHPSSHYRTSSYYTNPRNNNNSNQNDPTDP